MSRLGQTAVLLLLLAPVAASAEKDGRPNIVLIMCDDMGFEGVSAYGSTSYKTPRLDRLASEGLLFRHCYSTPICTTSRVQLMTGKYNFRNYVKFGHLDTKETTFANLLKNAGYETAIGGKWQLEGNGDTVRGFGFDEYCLWHIEGRESRFWEPRLVQNDKLREDVADRFGPDVVTDFLVDFIKRPRDAPFLVYYPMMLVHWPFVPTPDSKPGGSRERLGKYDGRKGGEEYFPDMVAYLDKVVARIDDALQQAGVRDNTLLLFTCDNGCAINITSEYRGGTIKGGKASLPDAGTHVALVASWPAAIKKPGSTGALVDLSDFLPTLTAAAGVDLPPDFVTDGTSFLDLLRGETQGNREWLFCHYIRNGVRLPPADAAARREVLEAQSKAKQAKKMGRWARTERYKLYDDGRFYNVQQDVLELKAIAVGEGRRAAEAARGLLQGVHDRMPPWQTFRQPIK